MIDVEIEFWIYVIFENFIDWECDEIDMNMWLIEMCIDWKLESELNTLLTVPDWVGYSWHAIGFWEGIWRWDLDMLMFISFGFIRRGTLCYSGVFWMDYIILVCLGGLYDTGVFWRIILVCFGWTFWCVWMESVYPPKSESC